MNKAEWVVDENHFATLALPEATADKYFSIGDVEEAIEDESVLDDGRVLLEITQIWKGVLHDGDEPTPEQLLQFWDIDTKVLSEEQVEFVGWCDG